MRWKHASTLVLVAVGVCWWLFGYSRYTEGPFTTTLHRRFGRVTRVDMFSTTAKQTQRMRVLYSWSEPYEQGDPITSCAAVLPETWQDWNSDGRWDTWTRRVGPDRRGECAVEYSVDLNGDEQADWRFASAYGEADHAEQVIKARRRF